MFNFLQGKKTYLIAAIVAIMAGLSYLGIEIPTWIPPLLAALGLTAVKSAIKKVEPK